MCEFPMPGKNITLTDKGFANARQAEIEEFI
jgi:hypothetical protein